MSMSLWNIDRTCEQMTECIYDMRANGEDTTEAEKALAEYITEKLPAKVDAIAATLRKWKSEEIDADEEARRCRHVAQSLVERAQRLKAICIEVLNRRGEPKLVGKTSALRVQNNGGPQALTIYDEKLIPESFKLSKVVVTLDEKAIREELSKPCKECGATGRSEDLPGLWDDPCVACGGTGFHLVPGAKLEPRGVQLRVVDR